MNRIDPVMKLAGGPAPIDMVLHCPACGLQHIDEPEGGPEMQPDGSVHTEEYWSNPPHRSHLCHSCGHIWRPADVPTNGVAAVKTRGQNDSPIVQPRRAARFDKSAMGRLLLEASTGLHGSVAERLCDAWCEMASQVESLKERVESPDARFMDLDPTASTKAAS